MPYGKPGVDNCPENDPFINPPQTVPGSCIPVDSVAAGVAIMRAAHEERELLIRFACAALQCGLSCRTIDVHAQQSWKLAQAMFDARPEGV